MLKITVIRETQIKTTVIYLYLPTLIAKKKKKKNTEHTKCYSGYRGTGNSMLLAVVQNCTIT